MVWNTFKPGIKMPENFELRSLAQRYYIIDSSSNILPNFQRDRRNVSKVTMFQSTPRHNRYGLNFFFFEKRYRMQKIKIFIHLIGKVLEMSSYYFNILGFRISVGLLNFTRGYCNYLSWILTFLQIKVLRNKVVIILCIRNPIKNLIVLKIVYFINQ